MCMCIVIIIPMADITSMIHKFIMMTLIFQSVPALQSQAIVEELWQEMAPGICPRPFKGGYRYGSCKGDIDTDIDVEVLRCRYG